MHPDSDDFPPGPVCPACRYELVREPLVTKTAITLAYVCPEHGPAFVVDPFS